MQSNNKGFYFVNKSGRSAYLSKSLPLEKAAIQRYVQTDRKRKRISQIRRVRLLTTSATDSTIVGSQPSVSPVQHAGPNGATLCLKTNARSKKADHGERSLERQQQVAFPSCQRALCKQDPFNSASIPISKAVAGLLHYYMNYYHPSQWPNEMAVLRQGVYMFEGRVLTVVRRAVADKLTMYSLLSAAACRLQFVDRLPCPLVAGRESYYIQEALRLMAVYVSTSNIHDEDQLNQFLTCILFLNSAEAFRGDMAAAQTHLYAAVRVLDPMGGLEAVENEHLNGSLAMADLFLACVKVKPCMFKCSYDPGPARMLELSDRELQTPCELSTASSLLNRPNNFILPKLRALIEELVESHTVKNRISTSSMSAVRATQVTHWVTLRNMAIRNKLLRLRTVDAKNHVLRIAIIMWSLLTMNVTGRAKTVKLMAPRLKDSLSGSSLSDWEGDEDIRLWIVLIGLYCASEENKTLGWFRSEFEKLQGCWSRSCFANARALKTAEQLEEFQRNFFFDVSIQRPQSYVLAQKLRNPAR